MQLPAGPADWHPSHASPRPSVPQQSVRRAPFLHLDRRPTQRHKAPRIRGWQLTRPASGPDAFASVTPAYARPKLYRNDAALSQQGTARRVARPGFAEAWLAPSSLRLASPGETYACVHRPPAMTLVSHTDGPHVPRSEIFPWRSCISTFGSSLGAYGASRGQATPKAGETP